MNTLIVVDLQNDFVPGGALPVPEGDRVIPVVNRLIDQFTFVVATKDWHPDTHGSFAASHPGKQPGEVIELNGLRQVLWPVHCVQGTPGADFVPGLKTERFSAVFQKGTDPAIDSYSGFFDNGHRKATGLGDYLKTRAVGALFVAGLATDYCVKFTVLDALALGYTVQLIEDACRGVNLQPGDVAAAVAEMRRAGAQIITSASITKRL